MAEWTILNWLDAGTTPVLVIITLLLWRLDRRVVKLETRLEIERASRGR